jgi:hypothetical protein
LSIWKLQDLGIGVVRRGQVQAFDYRDVIIQQRSPPAGRDLPPLCLEGRRTINARQWNDGGQIDLTVAVPRTTPG